MKKQIRFAALSAIAALTFAGCATGEGSGSSSSSSAAESSATAEGVSTVSVTDQYGEHEVPVDLQRVVATDNRIFETLQDWEVPLVAAPQKIIPTTISYRDDDSIVNLGNHREPDLEAIVAAEPDLVLNGQRFRSHYEEITKLVPDATVLDYEIEEGEKLDEELKHQITDLGKIFQREDDAKKLNENFDASIAAAKDAYDPDLSVMAVIVSGGEIGYVAPSVGRTLGPVFDLLDLTPALEVENVSDDHQGDDISVEAIAAANPDILLVMDRDAAIKADDPEYTPALEVLTNSEALKDVAAIKNDAIVVMDNDTYTNEGIQTYTDFFSTLAEKFSALKK
ncbi:putative ABC transporter solute-binding protein YclQ precursor [Corynebacterium ciconiae DSM 44920]|uniref:siderophore ABC transporter substrate-binding protein n=1 Tax=Corynebacterium ciconiae TaxID=227319 RepID=UPI00036FA4F2|nr:ABC transporter substrate-binding protein [Corynebacterium ciconiae]WKD61749.1 putative ABC transporter solute-binding protein YclQ precursor [Corynebacterium ciconiae DSM 44920]